MGDKRVVDYSIEDYNKDDTYLVGVKNAMVKRIRMGDVTSVSANPSTTPTESLNSIEIGGVSYSVEGGGGGNVDVDTERGWLLVSEGGHNYFAPLTELVAPNKPTISTTTYYVVTGNASVSVSSSTSGASVSYKVDDGSWTNGSTITLASGFQNNTSNTDKQYTIQVKATKNGVESGVNSYTITIKPKVAAGSLSVTRTPNNNDWATQATITFTASSMSGTTSRYSTDGGTTWTAFTGTHTETITESAAANKFRVKIDSVANYQDASVTQSSAITLNKKKFYYGRGGATLANEAAIKALVGGGSEEKDTMAGSYDITSTELGQFTWFCGTGTLTSVSSSGFGVPMNAVVVVDGYNCYRSASHVMNLDTDTFNVS
jgi:hypothetical protein